MSDEAAQHFANTPASEPSTAGRSVTLSVTLHPNGQMDYSLPSNEILSYGMLEKARAKVDELALLRQMEQAKASRGGMNGLLKRMNGG